MANEEDVRLLDKHMATIEMLRNRESLDLSGMDLRGRNLSCAYLEYANLSGANLPDRRQFERC